MRHIYLLLLIVLAVPVIGTVLVLREPSYSPRELKVKQMLDKTTIVQDLRSNGAIFTRTELQRLMPELSRLTVAYPKLVTMVIDDIDVESIVVKSIAETYTDAEITALNSFVSTPIGQAVAKKTVHHTRFLQRHRIWNTLREDEEEAVRKFSKTSQGRTIDRKSQHLGDVLMRNLLDELNVEAQHIIEDILKRGKS
jgi:predicted ribosome quality control (RQC) complex YloA/Tae2 family protein